MQGYNRIEKINALWVALCSIIETQTQCVMGCSSLSWLLVGQVISACPATGHSSRVARVAVANVSTSTPPTVPATDWSSGGLCDQSEHCMHVLRLSWLINSFRE